MALGNKKSENAKTNEQPKFEDEAGGNQAVAEKKDDVKSAETQETPAASPAPDAGAAATTAIAKAQSTALSVDEAAKKAKEFQKELDAMKGATDFDYGTYRVFKANQGEIQESGGEEENLGRWAKVRLLAWDNHFEVSPGEQGASTKDFVAYSKDGQTIDSVIGEEMKSWVGKPVAEYLAYLKDDKEGEGFENAKIREFIDTSCALLGSDSGDGPIGKVIQVTLASSSISAFKKYQTELKDAARCVAMGLPGFTVPEDPFTFYYLREAASKGNQNWTKLKIVAELPAKI